MWAPPEDDTVTPGPTWTGVGDPPSDFVTIGDVVGAVDVGCAAAAPSPADAGLFALVVSPTPAAGVWLFAGDESLAVSGFAQAIPAGAAIVAPIPNATARAPIRPMKSMFFNVHTSQLSDELPASHTDRGLVLCGFKWFDVNVSLTLLLRCCSRLKMIC